MKYTAVMGNPPYTRAATDDASRGAVPIYQIFFLLAAELGNHSSIISPGRWMKSPKGEMRAIRKTLQEGVFRIPELHFMDEDVFTEVIIRGGVTWYLNATGHQGSTNFHQNLKFVKQAPLFDSTGTISFDRIAEIRDAIKLIHRQPKATNKLLKNWITPPSNFSKVDGFNNDAYFKNSTSTRQSPSDIKMRMTNGSWRYFSPKSLPKDSYIPLDACGFGFAGCSSNSLGTINDRSMVLSGGESTKGTVAVILPSLPQTANFYKYARTKFFATLCLGRLSSHNAYPQTYQDIPMFSFTENDPLNWSLSIPEIDEQLIAHFGLEDYREYILSASKPYARALGQEYLDRLTEANVDTSRINEWYDD